MQKKLIALLVGALVFAILVTIYVFGILPQPQISSNVALVILTTIMTIQVAILVSALATDVLYKKLTKMRRQAQNVRWQQHTEGFNVGVCFDNRIPFTHWP